MAIFFLFELYKFIVTLVEVKRPQEPELDEDEIKRRAIEEYLASQKKEETSEKPAEPEPVKEEPAKETPTEETPAEEAPAEEAASAEETAEAVPAAENANE